MFRRRRSVDGSRRHGAAQSDVNASHGSRASTPSRSRRTSGGSVGTKQSRSSSTSAAAGRRATQGRPVKSEVPTWIKGGHRDSADALEAVTAAILGHGIEEEGGYTRPAGGYASSGGGDDGGFGELPLPMPLGMGGDGSIGRGSAGGTTPRSGTGRRKPEWKMALRKAPEFFKLAPSGEPVRVRVHVTVDVCRAPSGLLCLGAPRVSCLRHCCLLFPTTVGGVVGICCCCRCRCDHLCARVAVPTMCRWTCPVR